jgi:hypothetical protein
MVPHRKIHWITLQNPRFGRFFAALPGSDSINDLSFTFPVSPLVFGGCN